MLLLQILCGVVAELLDYDMVVSEFELKSRYYVHFRTNNLLEGMNTQIPQSNNAIAVLQEWLWY